MKMPSAAIVFIVLVMSVGPSAQRATPPAPKLVASDCLPTPDDLKALALDLRKQYTDDNNYILALDTAVGVDSVAIARMTSTTVHYDDSLSVFLFFPYRSYRFSLQQAIRKRDPIESINVPRAVLVVVSPSQITSPDIVKVIVERDGKPATPLMSTLEPRVFETRVGAKKMLHSGEVAYRCSVFAPGATVTVTAIPEIGNNFVKTFTSDELAQWK